ncbi:MAG: CRISPR-associated endonuclease Cas3'' [Fervidobacterium sp.]
MIYAKSNPKETLKEHTQKLIDNLEILKKIYQNRLKKTQEFWELLKFAAFYHDFGKIDPVFQNKIRNKIGEPTLQESPKKQEKEIPHNYLSIIFLDKEKIIQKYGEKKWLILLFRFLTIMTKDMNTV